MSSNAQDSPLQRNIVWPPMSAALRCKNPALNQLVQIPQLLVFWCYFIVFFYSLCFCAFMPFKILCCHLRVISSRSDSKHNRLIGIFNQNSVGGIWIYICWKYFNFCLKCWHRWMFSVKKNVSPKEWNRMHVESARNGLWVSENIPYSCSEGKQLFVF